MGLLDKAKAGLQEKKIYTSGDISTLINDFHRETPLLHYIILQFKEDQDRTLVNIAGMTASHNVLCCDLSNGNGLVILPGGLDMELFSHQLSRSTHSTVLFQFSANTAALAFETLLPYLQ